ncbi:MAG: glycosyltransferase family 4 protein [Burkholderiaceae bacterium]|nr:MAG: glycosyltransferase family 4 protein [Burkholderiaceae bacterium]
MTPTPRIVVFSSLFPHERQPHAGLFIRERMFRVAQQIPLVVVSPRPWFPLQGLLRKLRPGYRPNAPRHEVQQGIEIFFPRFLALPGLGRRWDGFMMALCSLPLLLRLKKEKSINLIDAHFAYPDGYAAALLGRWLKLPVTITLRGSEPRQARVKSLRQRILKAGSWATRIFAVSNSLREAAISWGIPAGKVIVVGNGVDLKKFVPIPQTAARQRLGLTSDARVLISVGGLVERKGFHRILQRMPALLEQFPALHYLIVGGASPEGDFSSVLKAIVEEKNLAAHVTFCGAVAPEQLHVYLSAADVFALATSNEGWANVLLEALACGVPVVTTDVGGNREVIDSTALGLVVPFGDAEALQSALVEALQKPWDRTRMMAHAAQNQWDARIALLFKQFSHIVANHRTSA